MKILKLCDEKAHLKKSLTDSDFKILKRFYWLIFFFVLLLLTFFVAFRYLLKLDGVAICRVLANPIWVSIFTKKKERVNVKHLFFDDYSLRA